MFRAYRSHIGIWRALPAWRHFMSPLSRAGGTVRNLILAGWSMLQFLLVETWGQGFATSVIPSLTKCLLFPKWIRFQQFGCEGSLISSTGWGVSSGGRTNVLFGSTENTETFLCEGKSAVLINQCWDTQEVTVDGPTKLTSTSAFWVTFLVS